MNRLFTRNEYEFVKYIMIVNPKTRFDNFYFSECLGSEGEKHLELNRFRVTTAFHYNLDDDFVTACISYNLDKNPHNVYIYEVEFKDFLNFKLYSQSKDLKIYEPFSFNMCLENCLN
jgi:hypothetical protein